MACDASGRGGRGGCRRRAVAAPPPHRLRRPDSFVRWSPGLQVELLRQVRPSPTSNKHSCVEFGAPRLFLYFPPLAKRCWVLVVLGRDSVAGEARQTTRLLRNYVRFLCFSQLGRAGLMGLEGRKPVLGDGVHDGQTSKHSTVVLAPQARGFKRCIRCKKRRSFVLSVC